MRVLVACEESQEVCKAFRARGHEAYSCDIQPCSGGHPEWHIIADVLTVLNGGWFTTETGTRVYIEKWDLMIAHPPCTYFAAPGMHYLKTQPKRMDRLKESFLMVEAMWAAPIDKICIENPVGWLNTNWKKPTQTIQPYYFGDNERKRTCLWLKGLSRLNGKPEVAIAPHNYIPKPDGYTKPGKDGYSRGIYFCGRINSANRNSNAAKLKSKTFPGIARAMAEQWG